jgi:hypothetical protein
MVSSYVCAKCSQQFLLWDSYHKHTSISLCARLPALGDGEEPEFIESLKQHFSTYLTRDPSVNGAVRKFIYPTRPFRPKPSLEQKLTAGGCTVTHGATALFYPFLVIADCEAFQTRNIGKSGGPANNVIDGTNIDVLEHTTHDFGTIQWTTNVPGFSDDPIFLPVDATNGMSASSVLRVYIKCMEVTSYAAECHYLREEWVEHYIQRIKRYQQYCKLNWEYKRYAGLLKKIELHARQIPIFFYNFQNYDSKLLRSAGFFQLLDGYSRQTFANRGLHMFKKGRSYIRVTIPNMTFGCVLSYVSRQPLTSFLRNFGQYEDAKQHFCYSAYTPERWDSNAPVQYGEFHNVLSGKNDFESKADFDTTMAKYERDYNVDSFRSLLRM